MSIIPANQIIPSSQIGWPSEGRTLSDHHSRIRSLESIPALAHYEIKVTSDLDILITGDNQFVWMVPYDLDTFVLADAQAFVSTASSSGIVTVQLRNVTTGGDMLSTRLTILVGQKTTYATGTTLRTIDPANYQVATGNLISVDVDVAGTGVTGLGVTLVFASL